MERQQELRKLLHDAKKVIVDFYEEQNLINKNILTDIIVDEEKMLLTTIDKCDLQRTYHLSEISSALKGDMEGFPMLSPSFYESYDQCIEGLQTQYNIMDVDTFIRHAGRLEYMKYRCEELFKNLIMIEAEAYFV